MQTISDSNPEVLQKDSSSRSPRSLMRVLNIFDALAKATDGMTLTALSTALDSPKSSLLALLRPMVASGFLTQTGSRYGLGPAIFQLSADILAGRTYSKLARVFLDELAERSGESIYLTTIDRDVRVVTYIESVESRQAVRYAVGAGAVRPLFVSAAGRLLLAYQDPIWVERFLASAPFTSPVTGKTIDSEWLQQELQQIRLQGYATSVGETVPGAAGIAAPIILPNGFATHALLLAAPVDRFQNALPALRDLILDVAARASVALRNARS